MCVVNSGQLCVYIMSKRKINATSTSARTKREKVPGEKWRKTYTSVDPVKKARKSASEPLIFDPDEEFGLDISIEDECVAQILAFNDVELITNFSSLFLDKRSANETDRWRYKSADPILVRDPAASGQDATIAPDTKSIEVVAPDQAFPEIGLQLRSKKPRLH